MNERKVEKEMSQIAQDHTGSCSFETLIFVFFYHTKKKRDIKALFLEVLCMYAVHKNIVW